MELALHPTPAGCKGASQLPRAGCGEHCGSGWKGIRQGCAHTCLLYFQSHAGAAQLQLSVGHPALLLGHLSRLKAGLCVKVVKPHPCTYVSSTVGHQLCDAAQLRTHLCVAASGKQSDTAWSNALKDHDWE